MCDVDVVKVFNCTRCDYHSRDFWRLLKHYQLVHGNDAGFSVQCGVENCFKVYNSIKALCAHTRAKHEAFHKHHLMQRNRSVALPEDNLSGNVSGEHDLSVNSESVGESEDNRTLLPKVVVCGKSDEDLANSHVAAFSLKLREINKVSGSVCEDIRQNMNVVLSTSREHLQGNVLSQLKDHGASVSLCTAVRHIFSAQTPYEKAFDSLTKEYYVNKYIEQNFPFVEPMEYVLKNLDRGDDNVEHMQYVPLLDMLKTLLNDDNIFSCVMNGHQSTDGKLRDFCDGRYFRQHPLFGTDDCALQIVLYYDDFGVVNPLGHRAKRYKISGFYFTLANVPPKDRSRLHTIYLSTVCFSSAIRRCGFDEVMRPLINDLIAVAEKGVTVERGGQLVTIKGALVAVVADNLAAHGIGGFFESFTSVYPCRFCLLRKSNLKFQFVSCSSMRTPETYQRQLDRISKFDRLQSVYGLKRNSCLNRIPNFHVVSGLPSDIMHDLLEGVACDILEYVIKYCINAGFITQHYLNCQIERFPYKGSDKVNRPDPISEPIRCRQTAAKCRCMLRLLPLMIGSKVPVSDRKWEVLLALLCVHDLSFSPVMSMVDTVLLDDAVETFLTSFTTEFENESVKPKMHFMVHYGNHCRMFGPLIQYWSFRFEGKHGYFKDIACRLKCRKNVLLTLARKHQYYQSWHLLRTSSLLRDYNICSSTGKQVLLSVLPAPVQHVLLPVTKGSNTVFHAACVNVDGILFECDMAVVTGVNNGEPSFSAIHALCIIQRKVYIVATKLENIQYQQHFHAYTGLHSCCYHLLPLTDIFDPFPLPVYSLMDNSACIVLKHIISS